MPIYEFYCSDCHTLFNFFSQDVAPQRSPSCPACSKVELERRPSTFATLKHRGEEEPTPFDHLDDARMESAMESLAQEMGSAGESEDPRQVGRLLRRLGEMTGLAMGPRMEDALERLERGEDLEKIEAEMGDGSDGGDGGDGSDGDDGGDGGDSLDDFFQLKKAVLKRRRQPRVDDTLYFL